MLANVKTAVFGGALNDRCPLWRVCPVCQCNSLFLVRVGVLTVPSILTKGHRLHGGWTMHALISNDTVWPAARVQRHKCLLTRYAAVSHKYVYYGLSY